VSKVFCTIHHFDLRTAPEYLALSYEWGGAHALALAYHKIFVDFATVKITQNLRDFFDYLDKNSFVLGKELWLWVDQLCIDQANVQERNHQVRNMAEIFRTASKVLIWLGLGWERELERRVGISDEVEMPNRNEPPSSGFVPNPEKPPRSVFVPKRLSSPKDHRLKDEELAILTMLPYWQRLWIIQEVVLARRILVIFKNDCYDWNNLIHIAKQRKEPSQSTLRVLRIEEIRQLSRTQSWRWTDVLTLLRSSRCTDVRDKAYGMLGLVHTTVAIVPNYEATAAEVVEAVIAQEFESWYGEAFQLELAKKQMDQDFKDFVWGLFLAFDVWTVRNQDPKLKYIREML